MSTGCIVASTEWNCAHSRLVIKDGTDRSTTRQGGPGDKGIVNTRDMLLSFRSGPWRRLQGTIYWAAWFYQNAVVVIRYLQFRIFHALDTTREIIPVEHVVRPTLIAGTATLTLALF